MSSSVATATRRYPAILATPARATYTLSGRFAMAIALIVIQVADLATTQLLIDAGGRESNPIAGHFLGNGNLVPLKIGLAGFIGTLLLVAPLRRRVEQTLWLVATAYAAVLGTHVVQLTLHRFS